MKQTQLTLITVTKDDPDGLARTLVSADLLRSHGAEHVVVNGGSDDSAANSAGPPEISAGIRVLRRPPLGVADAFNAGLAAATGEWVWFLNGGDQIDERLNPAFLMELIRISNADVLIGGIAYAAEEARPAHPPPRDQWPSLAPWVPHPASLVRRRLFERFGGFDPRYQIAMDYEWWLRVLGRDVTVDLLDIPFVVFAPGGMSQRPEMRARLNQERDDIIRRHQGLLWRNELRSGLRLTKSWLRALFARRLREPVKPS
jgi:glycosyltransferase involved in cell wall biosynthesis